MNLLPAGRFKLDRVLMETLLSLYGIQALSLLLPLLMWPRLARVLGPALAGSIALAEAAARYVALVVEYGFQFSASREICQSHGDAATRARIAASVVASQVILASGAAFSFLLAALAVPALFVHWKLTLSAFVWGVSLGACPVWYFQGVERMRFAAGVDAACRIAAVLLILTFVRDPEKYWLAPAFSATAALTAAAICWRRLASETPLRRVLISQGWDGLKSGFHVFVFRGTASFYTTANVLLLGLFARPEAVGFFTAAEKLVKASLSALYPVSQAMYPRIARLLAVEEAEARKAVVGSLRVTAGAGVFGGLTMAAAGDWLVGFVFGPAFAPASRLVLILCWLGPLISVSNVLGLQWMLPNRMERAMNGALAAGAATCVALASALAPAFGAVGMCWAVVGAEAAVTAGVLFSLARAGRLPWTSIYKQEELVSC